MPKLELEEQGTLQMLLQAAQRNLPERKARRAQKHKTQEPRRRCKCGTCLKCVEEARWERVFQEKFADPSYYKTREPRLGSTLGWLGRQAA